MIRGLVEEEKGGCDVECAGKADSHSPAATE